MDKKVHIEWDGEDIYKYIFSAWGGVKEFEWDSEKKLDASRKKRTLFR
jgi:hypothetical protein